MCSCPLENHSCLQHVPEELANFHFLKYETHPSNLSVTHWEWPPWMRVQVEILSNMTDLGQGQHQTKTPDSMQHAGEYLVTTNIHTHKNHLSQHQPCFWTKQFWDVSHFCCNTMTFLREIGMLFIMIIHLLCQLLQTCARLLSLHSLPQVE